MQKKRSRVLSLLLALCLVTGLACVPAAAVYSSDMSYIRIANTFDFSVAYDEAYLSTGEIPLGRVNFDVTNTSGAGTPGVVHTISPGETSFDIVNGDGVALTVEAEVGTDDGDWTVGTAQTKTFWLDLTITGFDDPSLFWADDLTFESDGSSQGFRPINLAYTMTSTGKEYPAASPIFYISVDLEYQNPPEPTSSDGFTFSFDHDGNATLTGYDSLAAGRPSHVDVPDTATDASGQSYPVTAIDSGVFQGCSWITSVTIPDSVRSIGTYAFSDTGLTSVTIPSSVTEYGAYIFSGCESLTSASLPENMTAIPNGLFHLCFSLSSVNLPSGLTSIGYQAFQRCSLTSADIPDGVTSIGDYAFDDNPLTSLDLPSSLREIGDGAFQDCGDITSLTLPEGLETIGQEAFQDISITSLYIPGSVKKIDQWAFMDCIDLTSVTFGEGITDTGYESFRNCRGLTDITFSSTVQRIISFRSCVSLETVTIPASVTSIGDGFQDCTSLRILYMKPMTAPRIGYYNQTEGVVLVIPKGATGYDTTTWREYTIVFEGDPIPEIPDEEEEKPAVSLSPTSLNFGAVDADGSRPAARTVTVTNSGNVELTLRQPAADDYDIGSLSRTTLAAGQTATFTVQPRAGLKPGEYDETVTLSTSQGVSARLTLSYTVEGDAAVSLSPTSLDFGSAESGYDQPAARTVTVTNSGDTQLTLTQPTADDYVIGSLSRTTLSAGQSATFTVRPRAGLAAGSYSETVSVRAGEAGSVSLRLSFTVAGEEEEPPAIPFTDVKEGDWYYEAVKYAYDNDVMNGTSGTSFAPNGQVSRAMVAQVLYNLAGAPAASGASFQDVPASAWYAGAVGWAAAEDIVSGYGGNTFGPDDNVTREQLAVMLCRYAQAGGKDVSADGAAAQGFADYASVSSWAADAVNWAVEAGLLSGKSGNRLDPAGTATRAELATILMRFCQL